MILKISSLHWLSCSWSPMSLWITHDLFLMPSINDSRDLVHWDNQREEDIIVIMRQYLMTIAKTSPSSSSPKQQHHHHHYYFAGTSPLPASLVGNFCKRTTSCEPRSRDIGRSRLVGLRCKLFLGWFGLSFVLGFIFDLLGLVIWKWFIIDVSKNRDLNKRDTRFVDNWRTLKTPGRWSGSWFFSPHDSPWKSLKDLEDSWLAGGCGG